MQDPNIRSLDTALLTCPLHVELVKNQVIDTEQITNPPGLAPELMSDPHNYFLCIYRCIGHYRQGNHGSNLQGCKAILNTPS